MQYDVVIVGAGPAGLAAACHIKQLNDEVSVCVLEKGSEVGAHIVSGAVFEPRALAELFPDWQKMGAPLSTEVSRDEVLWLSDDSLCKKVPSWAVPYTMHNKGNYIISLANLCRWLAEQAEALGVDVFPGFAAAHVLYDEQDKVKGVITGDMGLAKDGEQKTSFTPGMELHGTYTLFAEGCRGHLGKELTAKYNLDQGKDPQHYGLGIKEIWKVPKQTHQKGLVVHSAGWPLSESGTTGGGFLYHFDEDQVAVGLITDLSYHNPYLSPFDEFQRYKTHPAIAKYLQGGQRLAYGARAVVKGGIQSQPQMVFPGGLIIGDNAGTLNFAKIKGNHTAMKSGMIAAQTVVEALTQTPAPEQLDGYTSAYQNSWAYQELHATRNFAPAIHKWGNFWGAAYAFVDIQLCRGALPWTLQDPLADHQSLVDKKQAKPIAYPKADGVLSFDKLSSVFLSNTNHEEDQPCHLLLKDPDIPLQSNLPKYDEPAQRYCPAGVYEIVSTADSKRFQINAQNCVHCKTCDIKDPAQNIRWVTPEGGGGPNYPNM